MSRLPSMKSSCRPASACLAYVSVYVSVIGQGRRRRYRARSYTRMAGSPEITRVILTLYFIRVIFGDVPVSLAQTCHDSADASPLHHLRRPPPHCLGSAAGQRARAKTGPGPRRGRAGAGIR
ncbi:protein of unknown function [Cupriavidus taiwanensis]|nr:protein of unknown function [Cupriavidus taiwanensis]